MHTDPKTKEQFVDRILSYDFDGDFTSLGENQASIARLAANKFLLHFPATGQRYEIVVRKPRKRMMRPASRRAPTVKKEDVVQRRKRIPNRLSIRA